MSDPRRPALSDVSSVKLALLAREARARSAELLRADPIAIIGMGCRFPGGADSPEKFWRLLADGVDTVSDVPRDRWDANALHDADPSAPGKSLTRAGAFLDDIDRFDAAYFGILPREAQQMDPQQRVFLEVAVDALDDAGLSRDQLRGSRASVFVASYHNDYAHLQYTDREGIDARTLTGNVHSVLANRLSFLLDLRGPSLSIDTACSSSLVAIHFACQSLRFGESDVSIAGGVSLMLTPDLMVALSKIGFMAPDGRCKTFDARADGFGRGEGCGVLILKRLSDAVADGDRVYAVVRGSAVNQDGRSTVLAAPNGLAQQELIREALANAQIEASSVGYVEAHGTGTMLGDPIEVEAIAATVGQQAAGAGSCYIGAAKANVGHMEAAAGVAGVIKVALAMQHDAIPMQPHFTRLNPHISLDGTRLAIPTALTAWPRDGRPRRAGTSGFGVGGTNAHVILEEAPHLPTESESLGGAGRAHLVPLSAQSPEALRSLAQRWVEFLQRTPAPVADLAYTAGARRSHLSYRLGVVGRSREELIAALSPHAAEAAPRANTRRTDTAPRLAFVFSGQGPQWFGMGRELFADEPVFRDALAACDAAFAPLGGWSIVEELKATEPASRLQQTEIAQPALVALQIALAALWESWGIRPDAVTGHSVGEIAALHAAGVLSVQDAMRVAWLRGRVMQAVTGQGAMAAVALSAADADAVVRPFGDRLVVGAFNSPRSVVLTGEPDALRQALAQLDQRGVFHRALPVAYAFHSPQMAPFQEMLAQLLADLRPAPATVPVYSTVTGALALGVRFDGPYFGRNVREPVRLADAIGAMAADGYESFLEIGPQPVLSASILETVESRGDRVTVVASLRRGKPERESLLRSAATLYTIGHSLRWEGLHAEGGEWVDLPRYPWQRERYWLATPRRGASETEVEGATGNPLLGRRIPLAGDARRHVYEARWSNGGPGGLSDHRIAGRAVLPAAAMLEMFRAAARDAGGSSFGDIESFAVLRPMSLPGEGERAVSWQITVDGGPDRFALELHESAPNAAGEQPTWRLIATAAAPRGDERIDELTEDGHRPASAIAAKSFYSRLSELGANFGPAFRALESIECRDHSARGVIQLASPLEHEARAFGIHPTLLDAAFQLCTAAAGATNAGERPSTLFIPLGADAFRVLRAPGHRLLAHAKLRPAQNGANASIVADVHITDDTGGVVAIVSGARFARSDIAAFAAADEVDPWIYQVAWRDVGAVSSAASADGEWLVFVDRGGYGDRVCAQLEQLGGTCQRAVIDPADEAAFADAVHTWRSAANPRGIVHLWSLDDEADAEAADLKSVGAVMHIAQALARDGRHSRESGNPASSSMDSTTLDARFRGHDGHVWVATRGAVRTSSAEQHNAVSAAGIWGCAESVNAEHLGVSVRVVDVDPATPADPSPFVSELLSVGPPHSRVALRSTRRFAPRLERHRPVARGASPRAPIVRPDATYWITGGLGALGLHTARWLVESGARHLALSGRRAPSGDALGTIRDMEQAGAAVRTFIGDVGSSAEVARVRDDIARSMPPLRGVIHAAGVVDDGALLAQTWDRFRGVLHAKAHGARALDIALRDTPLDFFVLYSSAAVVLSSPGQSSYTAANAQLDALAHARQSRGQRALSVGWGAWNEGGMAHDLSARGRDPWSVRGVAKMAAADAFRRLETLLYEGVAHAVVLPIDWTRFMATLPAGVDRSFFAALDARHSTAEVASTPAPASAVARLRAARPSERRSLLFAILTERVVHVLGADPGTLSDPTIPLKELGLDSLMSVEVANALSRALGHAFPVTLVFDHPTLDALASHITRALRLADDNASPERAPNGASAAGDARAALAGLSDEEAEALLLAELDGGAPQVGHD